MKTDTAIRASNSGIAGIVQGDTLRRTYTNAHVLRKLGNALCFERGVLDECKRRGVRTLHAVNTETGDAHEIGLDDFLRRASPINFGTAQLGLSLRHWHNLADAEPAEQQLGLFGA